MTRTAVVALGGNAFTLAGQAGTSEEMLASARVMAAAVSEVIAAGWRVVVVHGNGPQVGNLALQQEATDEVPAQPLAALGAMTQGQLGSIIASSLDDLQGPGRAVALITHVIVDPADPAFAAPAKPIGPFFTRTQARHLAAERGWQVRPDAGRGYRRVVASPEPVSIVEIAAIRALVRAGLLVIAAGGGGIPVYGSAAARIPARGIAAADAIAGNGSGLAGGISANGGASAVALPGHAAYADAVIDKDRAARLLASQLEADALVLVTAVDRVMLDYGTPRQRGLSSLTAGEAARYLADGQFPAGSMGPKVEAALRFLDEGGDLAVITSPALLAATLAGAGPLSGTRIEPSLSRA